MGEEKRIKALVKDSRPFWKKKRWWAIGVVVLMVASFHFFTIFIFESGVPQFKEVQNFDTEMSRLQDRVEYKVIRAQGPDYKEVVAADKFPTALSCLKQSEQKEKLPSVLELDWNKTNEEIDVCLFRIFVALKTRENIQHWLQAYEYSVHEIKGFSRDSINGSRALTKFMPWHISIGNQANFPSRGWYRVFISLAAYGESVTVTLSRDNVILGVQATHTFL